VIRRDRLYREDGKLDSAVVARGQLVDEATQMLESIQRALHMQARARIDANIRRDIIDFAALAKAFEGAKPGWVEVSWSKPSGAELDKVVERLKALKLTFRNVPGDAAAAEGACIFTGAPAVERILVARAY
jgi:prolyl-tRNA synthetase